MTIDLLPLATYCALMSSTPGPNNMMLTTSGARFGYWRTLPQILGIALGVLLQTLLCCLGLGALVMALPGTQLLLRVAGALYLLWLAWQLLRSSVVEAVMPAPISFAQGCMFQAINPKAWSRSITIGAVFMPPELGPLQGAALVSALGALIGVPCVSIWALFGVGIRRWLSDARVQRRFNAMMAAGLAIMAISFLC